MSLTNEQLVALKNDIAADPVLSLVEHTSDGAFEIAVAYNQTATPQFVVWKTDIPTSECKKAMVWTEYISRSVGERDAWKFMLSNGTIDAGDVNIRQGIQDVFSGPGGAESRAALIGIAKRDATRAEKMFADGTGSDASPATMTFEGNLNYQTILLAWQA